MRKYQAWAIADIGSILLAVALAVALVGYLVIHHNISTFIAIWPGWIVFYATCRLCSWWVYKNVSIEEKFYHGGDDY